MHSPIAATRSILSSCPPARFHYSLRWRVRRAASRGRSAMHEIFGGVAVIPVLTIGRAADAAPLALALARGGLRVIEVTLRTPEALPAIREIRRRVPDAIVGAGTVLTSADVTRATEAGARLLVSPGLTPELAGPGRSGDLPSLPGAARPSEVMVAGDLGFSFLKFFPAAPLGASRPCAPMPRYSPASLSARPAASRRR